ncbi:MAG: binding protein excisionase family [Nocardioides sp.]|nr:binding protein excisionase family [Nocardioides sp.]
MPAQQRHASPRVPLQRVLPVYLSIEEAAEVMSLSTKTIRRRISDGSIPAYRCGRRNIRIRLDELEAAFRRLPSTGH